MLVLDSEQRHDGQLRSALVSSHRFLEIPSARAGLFHAVGGGGGVVPRRGGALPCRGGTTTPSMHLAAGPQWKREPRRTWECGSEGGASHGLWSRDSLPPPFLEAVASARAERAAPPAVRLLQTRPLLLARLSLPVGGC